MLRVREKRITNTLRKEIEEGLAEYNMKEDRTPRHVQWNMDYFNDSEILPVTDDKGRLIIIGSASWQYVIYPFGRSYFN